MAKKRRSRRQGIPGRSAAASESRSQRPHSGSSSSADTSPPHYELGRRSIALGSALAAGIALCLYLLTLEPGLPTGDSGELISAAWAAGVPHPPGYPLYMILGWLVTRLPLMSPAFAMNLLSAVLDVATVAIVFAIVIRIAASLRPRDGSPQTWTPVVAGAVGALSLGFSVPFWSYSVVAEVFALNNLIAALLLLSAIEFRHRPDRSWLLYAMALLLGLGLANQQTIILLTPALAIFVLPVIGGPKVADGPAASGAGRAARRLGTAVLFGIAGLLPYVYLPIAAGGHPPVNWGDPETLPALVAVVSRASYGTFTLTSQGQSGSILEQLGLFSSNLVDGFTLIGCALAVGGAWMLARRGRAIAAALVTAVLVSGPFFLAFANVYISYPLIKGIIARFYILPAAPFAVLVGAGALWLIDRARELAVTRGLGVAGHRLLLASAIGLTAVSPVMAATLNYAGANRSDDHVAELYGQDLLGNLQPNAVLIMRGDENYNSVVYAQVVSGIRTDVIALDAELLKDPSYVTAALRDHPGLVIPWPRYDGGLHTSLASLVAANIDRHPVYYIGKMEEPSWTDGYDDQRAGLVDELVAKGKGPDAYGLLKTDPSLVTRLHFPGVWPNTTWENVIGETYASAAFSLAFALQTGGGGDTAEIERYYRLAIQLGPTNNPDAYKNLGVLLQQTGGASSEVASLWRRYLELLPNAADADAIRRALESMPGGAP